jgi:glycosyltransferase involved in cell wall biosynthesis
MNESMMPRILAVGSLPPPLGGTSVSFQVLCDEVRRHADKLQLDVIDAAPRHIKEDARLLTLTNFVKAGQILWHFLRRVKVADRVLIVGSYQFLFTIGSMCLFVAKIAGKPCYFRSFGFLDCYYDNLSPLLRRLFRYTVGHLDGLFVETQLVQAHLANVLGDKVHWVPGYRHMPDSTTNLANTGDSSEEKLRLVFLSQVREEKGIFVLLESLRTPRIRGNESIHCDIYGPVFPSIRDHFEAELSCTATATYKGLVKPEDVVATLRQYDALVFPTFWPGEGHPGVVMEAMIAGIAVITTKHRSVPELVQDRVNGLLTQPKDVQSLTEAICTLNSDRQLLSDLARRNWEMRTRHAASTIVPFVLQLMGLDSFSGKEGTVEATS